MPIPMGKGPHGGALYAPHYQIFWLVSAFLKVLGILKPFFQEGFKRGQGQSPSFPINCNFQYPIQTPNSNTQTDAQSSASWSTHVHFSHFP